VGITNNGHFRGAHREVAIVATAIWFIFFSSGGIGPGSV
jgi:hypothetical protein